MTEQSGKAKEISLGEDFGDVILKVNGVCVEVSSNGSILAYTNGIVKVSPAASAAPKIGDKMPDGTIYAGISPDTHKPMYATPQDASLTMTFNQAKEYAAKLDAHGHQDWRVPSGAELDVLFNNRAAIGGFNETGSAPAGWYRSSSPTGGYAWGQNFSDGYLLNYGKDIVSSLRPVR